MSYKKIVVSDGGKLKEIDVSIDTTSISSSIQISVNTASIGSQDGLIKINNGIYTSLTGTSPNQILKFSDSQYIIQDTAGGSVISVGGDLKYENGKILLNNISNVVSGTLSASYGGTGNASLSGSSASGSLISTNNAILKPSSPNQLLLKSKNSSIIVSDNKHLIEYTSAPTFYLYTGTIGSDRYITWAKPSNCKTIRVVCQGGGGGGGAGDSTTGGAAKNGRGGGGGGFSTLMFGAEGLPSTVNIRAGAGGAGGSIRMGNGTAGGESWFGTYLSATGGGLGAWNAGGTVSTDIGGAGGSGYSGNGGYGENYRADAPDTYEPAPGGGPGGDTSTTGGNYPGRSGGGITRYGVPATGVTPVYNPAVTQAPPAQLDGIFNSAYLWNMIPRWHYLNNAFTVGFPQLLCSGGRGGGAIARGTTPFNLYRAGNGGSPAYGSGGGGGGVWIGTTPPLDYFGRGGSGGVGYVLIICW